MKENIKIEHSWKPLFSLLKTAKIPWIWYILNVAISMAIMLVYAGLPQVQGQIMTGEIQDTGTIVTYVLVSIAAILIMMPTALLGAWVDGRTTRNLRQTIWTKIVHMPMRHLDTVPPTSLVSRVTSDVDSMSLAISYVIDVVKNVYAMAIILVMVAGMNLSMALMMLSLVPCIIIANIPSHYMHDARHQAQAALSRYTNFLAERLGALKQIKASGAEGKEDVLNDEAAMDYFKANMRMAKLELLAQPLTYGMDAVVQAIILIYGGYLLSEGIMDSASMVALYTYAGTLSMYAYQFVFFWQSVKQVQGASHTVAEFIQCEPETMERQRSFAIPDADLRLEDVSFSYEDGKGLMW